MERNLTLDYFKIFLAILVIMLHYPIDTQSIYSSQLDSFFYEWIKSGFSRISVPCFFIINGYFININDRKKMKKHVIHLIIIYITWSLFYLPKYATVETKPLLWILCFGYYHLWYLVALVQAIFVYYFLDKIIKNQMYLLALAVILFVCGYIIQMQFLSPVGVNLNKFRNFLFVGLPFIMIGNIIKTININKYQKLTKLSLFISFILFIFEIYTKSDLYNSDLYLSLILLCPLLIIVVLMYPKYSQNMTSIGSLSSAMYFIHPFILTITMNALNAYYVYFLPCIILVCVLFSFLIIYSNKTIKILL